MRFLLVTTAALALGACTAMDNGGSTKNATATPGSKGQTRAAPADDRIFAMPYVLRELDNGLKVMIVKTDYPDIVSLQIPVQTGSRNEVEPGKSGFAHFFEHMMFRGTEKYPPEVYGEILKNAGADQNAYTTSDFTNYHITFTKADLDKVLELEADRFQNLSYSEEQFRTEALAVKGEYLKNYSNPVQKIFEKMREISFKEHTYRHTTMGYLRDIEDMPNQLDYSKTFFDRWYRPEKSTLILVGDLDPEDAFAKVKKHFGNWKRGSYASVIPTEPPPSGPIYEHIAWEAQTQPWLIIAFRGPRFDPSTKDMPGMDVLSSIYFSQSSDVYQKIVNQERLADQFFSFFPDQKDPEMLWFGARLTDGANASKVRDAIYATLSKARTELVDEKQLEETLDRLRYQFAGRMDNSEAIGGMLARFLHFDRDPEVINNVYRQYSAITAQDLKRLANVYFVDRGRSIISLSNEPQLAGFDAGVSLDAQVTRLANRPQVDVDTVSMPSSSSPLVDVAFLFHTGAAYDPAGKKGLAALTAAMVTGGGSTNRGIKEIDQALYPMASSFDAQIDKEMTRLSGSVHQDNLEAWYALASDQLLNPGWRDEDFERVKKQLINGVRTDLVGNNDEELGKEVLYAQIYGASHPYGSFNGGHSADLEKLTLDDVRAFYQQHYTTQNLTLGLAGGYDAAFAARVKSDLARLPQGARTALTIPQAAPLRGRDATIVQKETPAVAVSFGFPIDLKRGDPDWVALWLARSWFGEHRSSNSHLYGRIRETRGMNYGDYAYIEYFPRGMFQFHPDANLGRQQQIFQVWIRPLRTNNDAHFATRVAMYELAKLNRDGMSEADFEATRNFLNKFVSLLVKTQSRQLGYALDSAWYQTPAYTDYVRAGLARLTVDDVNRVIRTHLNPDNMKLVFIAKDADDLKKRLANNTPSPIEYNTPKPELAAEDAEISSLSLGIDAASIKVVPAAEVFN